MFVLMTFLLLLVGAALLGCASIISIIMIIMVIMGSYNGYVALSRASSNRLVKLPRQIPTIQRPSSNAFEA